MVADEPVLARILAVLVDAVRHAHTSRAGARALVRRLVAESAASAVAFWIE